MQIYTVLWGNNQTVLASGLGNLVVSFGEQLQRLGLQMNLCAPFQEAFLSCSKDKGVWKDGVSLITFSKSASMVPTCVKTWSLSFRMKLYDR